MDLHSIFKTCIGFGQQAHLDSILLKLELPESLYIPELERVFFCFIFFKYQVLSWFLDITVQVIEEKIY